ncbi:HNH endonuclease signature motif containing protein [Kutzneria kofuensis]|uniref:HNH endonuclease signature motif containing protein n=1 Tax=Kutzneria kofuensis TaxID=103725 RepID=UPI0031E5A9B0
MLAAVAECDRIGEPAFLRDHGFLTARSFPLVHDDRRYDARAIVGVAHGEGAGDPLRPEEFRSGDETIALVLQQLGFEVEHEAFDDTAAELLSAARGLTSAEAIGLLWVVSRFRHGELAELDEGRLAELLSEYEVVGSAETVFADLRADWMWARTEDTASLSEQARLSLTDDRCAEALAGHLVDMYLHDIRVDELLQAVRPPIVTSERAWSLLTKEDDREFQGNGGYDDITGKIYAYDATVPHYRNLAEGHLVILRDSNWALGAATVERIDAEPNQVKTQKRCPSCGFVRFRPRETLEPRYRCRRCRHTFDEPATELIPTTVFRAHYGGTWTPLDPVIDKDELAELTTDRAVQNAIRPMDVVQVTARLKGLAVQMPASLPSNGGGRDSVKGGSRRAMVRVRTGQQGVRQMLFDSYGSSCAVTGPCPREALQAAHLRGFAKHQEHRRDQGLLLRADIHSLFDRGMVAVDPDRLVIVVDPGLLRYEQYADLDGRPLCVPEGLEPDRSALADHHALASAGWES